MISRIACALLILVAAASAQTKIHNFEANNEGGFIVDASIPTSNQALLRISDPIRCIDRRFFQSPVASEESFLARSVCWRMRGEHIMLADFGGGVIACNEFGEVAVLIRWSQTEKGVREFNHGVR